MSGSQLAFRCARCKRDISGLEYKSIKVKACPHCGEHYRWKESYIPGVDMSDTVRGDGPSLKDGVWKQPKPAVPASSPEQPETGGLKHDDGKLRWDLLPTDSTREIVSVLTMGCKKYGARNWEKGLDYSRFYAALLRHLSAWWEGEDKDPESGLSHLAHVACNAVFLLTFVIRGVGKDDRPNK